MPDLWLDLLPIAIAMAITPGRLLALILLFNTGRPLLTTLAFVAGMASNMLIEGLAFALIFSITAREPSRRFQNCDKSPHTSMIGDRTLKILSG